MEYNELNNIAKGNARINYINEFCAYDSEENIPKNVKDIEYAITENKLKFNNFGNIID